MADKTSVVNNPFAALFSSVDEAELYIANKQTQQSTVLEDTQPSSLTDEEVVELTRLNTKINLLLENVFLLTLDKEVYDDSERPSRCVYMSSLAEGMDGQIWLDTECIYQAVFERLLLDSPGTAVISTRVTDNQPTHASVAGESQVLRYLYQCYERAVNIRSNKQYEEHEDVIEKCFHVILTNSKTCLQQVDLYPGQDLHTQFIQLYMENNDYLSDNMTVVEYFLRTCEEIETCREDGDLHQVFTPVLEKVATLTFTIMHPEVNRYIKLLSFFTQTAPLAEVLIDFTAPKDWSKGIDYEKSLLGTFLSLSCIPGNDNKPHPFFQNPSTTPKQEHDIAEKNIWQPLSGICESVYLLLYNIIKLSPVLRHKVLNWLGKCIHANSGRAKIWTSHAPQIFNQYCSDGFSLNMCHIMLKLCKPFSVASSDKLLKIQPSYVQAVASDETDARTRAIHAQGLSKETCLTPLPESETGQDNTETYNFITESFFLCHQAINQGFHAVHEKFLKLNQELHRIQRAYQDMRGQYPNEEQEPMRSVKMQMEKGMTMFLSLKAALTEPKLLEMSLNFHIATSTWLVQVATSDDLTKFQPITFPLTEEAPISLAYCPEFIMGNVTNYTLFLHRFKDQMYESGGDGLQHFMTLILVFMGSSHRMKNPHLRAELAETLAALMPQNPDATAHSTGMLSKYYREHLFESHPLIQHLSEKLLHVFVSIEETGQSVQFEQKFNYRRPMYQVLHYIWEAQLHKDAIKKMAEHTELHIEDTDPPLFLRFINLLINDAIFLLDEAIDFMKQLKEKQTVKEGPEWAGMSPRQQQEYENNVRQIGMMAKYHNAMGNQTILTLEMISREIKSIFCHKMMVDRVAAMLNYFLLILVGPKQRELKVKDKNEFDFKPGQLVSDITKIYLQLSDNDDFCRAVTGDGRSYSKELFPKACHVLQKIGTSPAIISDFETLHGKICAIGDALQAEEELLADAPEEFLDPIMGTLMKDPVRLPTSGNIVDRPIIARHILSDQNDPFNREPLNLDMVQPDDDLRHKIEAWIQEQRTK